MAKLKELRENGNWQTLVAAFLYFDMSFMIWTILGPLSTEIVESFAKQGILISSSETATLLSIPIISGSFLRIILGFSVDKIGAKKTALISQIIVICTLLFTYYQGNEITYETLLIVAIFLGFAGASFAVALPQVGQWYPSNLQGLVLGIAGAANIGVVMGFLFAPKIAIIYGWQYVFLLGAGLTFLLFIIYFILAKDAPTSVYKPKQKKMKEYWKLLKDEDTWWFNLFYGISFGGFVGFGVFLKLYLMDTYPKEMEELGMSWLKEEEITIVAGYIGAICILSGTMLRPVGGAIADKIGGVKSLYIFFGIVVVTMILEATTKLPFWSVILLILIGMANLGMANGAVFQLVPQKFGKEMGVMVGIIGASGGLGGAIFILTLGWSKEVYGEYSIGFLLFAGVTLIAIMGISLVKKRWRTTWGLNSGGII